MELEINKKTFFIIDEKLTPESNNIEYKNYSPKIFCKKINQDNDIDPIFQLKKIICAFYNSQGGNIFIGINDQQRVKGMKLTQKLQDMYIQQFQNLFKNFIPDLYTQPQVPCPKLVWYPSKGIWVLRVQIPSGDKHSLYSFNYYKKKEQKIFCFIRENSKCTQIQDQVFEQRLQNIQSQGRMINENNLIWMQPSQQDILEAQIDKFSEDTPNQICKINQHNNYQQNNLQCKEIKFYNSLSELNKSQNVSFDLGQSFVLTFYEQKNEMIENPYNYQHIAVDLIVEIFQNQDNKIRFIQFQNQLWCVVVDNLENYKNKIESFVTNYNMKQTEFENICTGFYYPQSHEIYIIGEQQKSNTDEFLNLIKDKIKNKKVEVNESHINQKQQVIKVNVYTIQDIIKILGFAGQQKLILQKNKNEEIVYYKKIQ
ncbi:hypothetical protein PPERSA_08102 [Pseudocohnilembus persalinus]|uniref:Schlafen AlbA-2 domain-containing protein n=1 Tax=Pseudocohnilembus persalinus TaxID=266149 RepID=A0A0V0R2R3_PSEPJ|nr:hypothetical protein PPERSA_08102 [Pseudocohnilembus persalinus]|eukprot:KRX08791.1 hypothetical protein PPERSA_08102 [Pseudocohnilembus persalinus]